MTNKAKASLRAISERYVRSQVRVMESSITKKDITRAVEKVNEALVELEKAKGARNAG